MNIFDERFLEDFDEFFDEIFEEFLLTKYHRRKIQVNNFNHQVYQSGLPVLFMVIKGIPSLKYLPHRNGGQLKFSASAGFEIF